MDRRIGGWLLVVLQFALLIALVMLPRRSPTLLSMAIGVPLLAAGAVLGLLAMRQLGAALTPTPVPLAGAGLRTDGVYRRVRHPIYIAILLMGLGYTVSFGTAWTIGGARGPPGLLLAQVAVGGHAPARALWRRVVGLVRPDRSPAAAPDQ